MIRPGTSTIARLRASRAYLLLAPALVVIFISLPGINQGDFRTDSHVYVAIVQEMLRSGDWIHPMQGNVPYHNKPPLGFWLLAPFIAAMGPTLLAVRIAMILIAGATASAVTGMCRELVSARVALTAGLVFALTHEVFRYTHAFSLDLPLLLFMVLGAWAVIHAAAIRRENPRSGWWIVLGGIPIGLALLTKPFVALLILPALILWLIGVHRIKLLPWIIGLLAVALTVALPWHLEMNRAYPRNTPENGDAFIDTYLFSQSIDRLSSTSGHVTEPAWYYLSELGQTYVPWVLFLVGGLIWILIKRRSVTGRWQADLLAILWAGTWIGLMSFSAGKSMRYIVPIYPALALFVAGVLVHMPPRGRFTPLVLPWIVGAAALIIARSPLQIHPPPPESRAEMFAFLDAYTPAQATPPPRIWIAPDQIYWASHFSIHRGFYPHVAISPDTPTGGDPLTGDLMLYRTNGRYVPRDGDAVLAEFGSWIITRLEQSWNGTYTTR